MNKKAKILFVYPSFKPFCKQKWVWKNASRFSFIRNGFDILRRHFGMMVIHYPDEKRVFKILIGILNSFLWTEITFPWFADIHAFMPVLFSKIFRRKSIVVVRGCEVANVPKMGGVDI